MLEKITVKNIIRFKEKSERSRVTFINKLSNSRREVGQTEESGGDYWITSSSAIANYFKTGRKKVIAAKVKDVAARRDETKLKQTIDMFERNISVLNKFEDFDFSEFKPAPDFSYLSKLASIIK